MGTAKRIYKNTVYLGVAEVISKILQFVVMLYAANLLSEEHFGKFSFALSLSLIAVILADLGINTLLVREISRSKGLVGKYFANAAAIKIVLSIAAYFVIVGGLNLMNYPNDTRQIVYVIWAFTILSTFTELFYSVFRAFEMMFYDAFLKVLRMILLTASSLYVLFNGYGVLAFSFTFVLVEFIINIVALCIVLKMFVRLKTRKEFKSLIDFSLCKSMFKKALPFGLAFVFGNIYFFIGSVMLSKIKGDIDVAVYSVAYNIALAILFIPTVYTNAIYPVLSRYYKDSKNELKILYEKSFKYLYIVGLPISVGLYFLSARIIFFFYGEKYFGSVIALEIISLYLVIKFINFLLGTVLSSIDQQNKRMVGQGFTALVNIFLNLLLIPKIGYVGAAWSTLITEIFLFMIYYLYVSKSMYFYNFINLLIKPAIAVIVMSFFIKFLDFGLALTVLFSALIYFASLWILKAFDVQDYDIVKRIFKNEKA